METSDEMAFKQENSLAFTSYNEWIEQHGIWSESSRKKIWEELTITTDEIITKMLPTNAAPQSMLVPGLGAQPAPNRAIEL